MRYQIDHHPDVTKFALENLDLRGTHVRTVDLWSLCGHE